MSLRNPSQNTLNGASRTLTSPHVEFFDRIAPCRFGFDGRTGDRLRGPHDCRSHSARGQGGFPHRAREKGETADELAAFASELRARATAVPLGDTTRAGTILDVAELAMD